MAPANQDENFKIYSRMIPSWLVQHGKRTRFRLTADVLKWAREWRGRSIDEVAGKAKATCRKNSGMGK